MNTHFKRMQKLFCVFFISLTTILVHNPIVVAAKAPQSSIYVDGTRQTNEVGVYVQSHYQLFLQSYNEKMNTAVYKIGVWWNFEGTAMLYSDNLYINGAFVGTFDGNNGLHGAGTIERGQWLTITLKGGWNTISTTNVEGVGGEFEKEVKLDQIGNPPTIVGTNGTWNAEDVSSGKRTWQSLYTDGATGSIEGNKVQTSTGFMYYDKDEAPNGVNAYHPSNPVGLNSVIDKIINNNGTVVDFNALNNPGVYTIYTSTKDTSGLFAKGTRKITVLENKYTIQYNGNGATSGSTPSSICKVAENCRLSQNGFLRQYKVTYNVAGGVVSTTSAMANATFTGWYDDRNGKIYENNASVLNLSNVGNVTIPLWAQWKLGTVSFPTPTRANYTFMGWMDGATNRGKGGTVYTPPSDMDLLAKWDELPKIIAKDMVFYENEYTLEQWLETIRFQDISASDLEDGNITSKIKVIDDNVNPCKRGVYTITYQVSDSAGGITSKKVNVTIKHNNPPKITAEDRWFYESDDITQTDLLERTKATDEEDGDISKRIKITSSNVQDHVIGDYQVSYEVFDSFDVSAKTTATIHIIPDTPLDDDKSSCLRFISKPYLDTLKPNSTWRSGEKASILNETLLKVSNSQAKEHWGLSSDDIKAIQEFNNTYNFSVESNVLFYEQFSQLIK